jgi:plasmid stabilization system protein ParE
VSLSFRIESEAAVELEEAAAWYEQKRLGLGQEFLEAVDEAVDFMVAWPRSGKPVPDVPPDLSVRRTPVRRFPYHVVYVVTQSAIRVLAVAHDRRSPGYWRNRVT